MSVLEVQGLRVWYGSARGPVRAVDGIDLTIGAGEIVGLVGESGSGKSTLGKGLLGLLPAGAQMDGDISLHGERVAGRDLHRRRGSGIGLVFQEPMTRLDPLMRVSEHFTELLRAHQPRIKKADRERRALAALRDVGIPPSRYQQYPHEFSGGMRQRIMIALTLVLRPALVVADEPTTALDVLVEGQILAMLAELRRAYDTALLLITHDLGVVAEACDRVAVMYAGRIVEHGDVRTVLDSPEHPYTRGLMASVPRLRTEAAGPGAVRQRLYQIGGSAPLPLRLTEGCAFSPRCPEVGDECWTVDPPTVGFRNGQEAVCHRRAEEKADLRVGA
jgi:oligopeptide/dipeptide ABC transporter ATP-binding protein